MQMGPTNPGGFCLERKKGEVLKDVVRVRRVVESSFVRKRRRKRKQSGRQPGKRGVFQKERSWRKGPAPKKSWEKKTVNKRENN